MTNRTFVLLSMFGLAFSLCAAEAVSSNTEEDAAAKKAAQLEKRLSATGGIIEQAAKGFVAVVNAQTKIPEDVVSERANMLHNILRYEVKYVKCDKIAENGFNPAAVNLPEGAAAAIFIVDDKAMPMSLVAIESGWGMMNVSPLDIGKRFNREFARVAVMTFGAGVSQFKGSPMQCVTTPADLDKLVSDGIAFDGAQSIMRNLAARGMTIAKKTTYRKACMEGWAPQPTNDYQKVIWEEVHAKPTNPMRIKFDPAKGE